MSTLRASSTGVLCRLLRLNGAIAHSRSIVEGLKNALVAHEAALAAFEHKHAADLEVVAEAAENAT